MGILRGHAEPVFELAFNSDGTKLISAGQHATIKLWDLTAEAGMRPFRVAAPSRRACESRRRRSRRRRRVRWVGGVAFRPDGHQLAAAGTHETVALWDFGTGRLERTLQAPSGAAFALSYNHDGTRWPSPASDRSVRIFDLNQR